MRGRPPPRDHATSPHGEPFPRAGNPLRAAAILAPFPRGSPGPRECPWGGSPGPHACPWGRGRPYGCPWDAGVVFPTRVPFLPRTLVALEAALALEEEDGDIPARVLVEHLVVRPTAAPRLPHDAHICPLTVLWCPTAAPQLSLLHPTTAPWHLCLPHSPPIYLPQSAL